MIKALCAFSSSSAAGDCAADPGPLHWHTRHPQFCQLNLRFSTYSRPHPKMKICV
jgi:hypothetical protein